MNINKHKSDLFWLLVTFVCLTNLDNETNGKSGIVLIICINKEYYTNDKDGFSGRVNGI